MARQSPPLGKTAGSHARTKKLIRIGGLQAVAALFAVAPERVEKLYFEERVASAVDGFCLVLGRMHRPYRRVEPDELARIAGTILMAASSRWREPRPLPPFDVTDAADWAWTEPLLLLLDGSATRITSAPSSEPPRSLGCHGSCCPIIRRKQVLPTPATASRRAAWNLSTVSRVAFCANAARPAPQPPRHRRRSAEWTAGRDPHARRPAHRVDPRQ